MKRYILEDKAVTRCCKGCVMFSLTLIHYCKVNNTNSGLHLKTTLCSAHYVSGVGNFMQRLLLFNILNGDLYIDALITELF